MELVDIKSEVEQDKISIAAKCVVCKAFFKLNVVGNRSVSINNYKIHAMNTHVQRKTKLLDANPSLLVKQQPKISSFFKKLMGNSEDSTRPDEALIADTFGGQEGSNADEVSRDVEVSFSYDGYGMSLDDQEVIIFMQEEEDALLEPQQSVSTSPNIIILSDQRVNIDIDNFPSTSTTSKNY